ncbi:MAG: class I SAM-dependent methyltransferase [Acidithiobacillus sp.]
MADNNWLERAVDQYTGRENLEIMKEAYNYNKYLMSLVRKFSYPDDDIVDFGAGSGTFALPLRRDGFNILCVEPDGVLRDTLRTNGILATSTLDDIKDTSVDYIYSLNVLEHISDDNGVLLELYRKLRPGGRIMIYVPAFQVLYSSMDRKVGHFRRYRRSELRNKMHESGFTIKNAYYIDSIGFFVSLLFRILDNCTGNINRKMLHIYDKYIFPASRFVDHTTSNIFGKNLLVVAERPHAITEITTKDNLELS